jgi:hypothetical protein
VFSMKALRPFCLSLFVACVLSGCATPQPRSPSQREMDHGMDQAGFICPSQPDNEWGWFWLGLLLEGGGQYLAR